MELDLTSKTLANGSGQSIKEQRKKEKMRQNILAARVGVSAAVMSGYERGEYMPPFSVLTLVARELSCDIEDLFPSDISLVLNKAKKNHLKRAAALPEEYRGIPYFQKIELVKSKITNSFVDWLLDDMTALINRQRQKTLCTPTRLMADKIKWYRATHNLTQVHLADATGIKYATLAHIENASRQIQYADLIRLVLFTGWPIEFWLEEDTLSSYQQLINLYIIDYFASLDTESKNDFENEIIRVESEARKTIIKQLDSLRYYFYKINYAPVKPNEWYQRLEYPLLPKEFIYFFKRFQVLVERNK